MKDNTKERVLYLFEEDFVNGKVNSNIIRKQFPYYNLIFAVKDGKTNLIKDRDGYLMGAKNHLNEQQENIRAGDWVFGKYFSGLVKTTSDNTLIISGVHKNEYYGYYKTEKYKINKIVKRRDIISDLDGNKNLNNIDLFDIKSTICKGAVLEGFRYNTRLEYTEDIQTGLSTAIFGKEIGPLQQSVLAFYDNSIILDSANGRGFIYKDGEFAKKEM